MKQYTVYRITNTVNQKYYIGVHRTSNPYDSYYGSGITINKAIAKYGKDNFNKEILYECEDRTEAYEHENILIGDKWKTDPKCYNEKPGGIGGWEHIDSTGENNCMKDPNIIAKVVDTKKQNGSYYTPASIAIRKKATAIGASRRKGQKDSEEVKKKRNAAVKAAHQRPEVRAKYLKAMEKKRNKYRLIDPNGVEHIIEDVSKWCKDNDKPISTITTKDDGYMCKRGKLKGWRIWTIEKN